MSQTFSYKRAPLGARSEITVDARGARTKRGGHRSELAFADVTEVRFVEIAMRSSSTSLVLIHRGGKFVINHGGLARESAHSENARNFTAACVAILDGLVNAMPQIDVRLGGGPALRWTMAGLGAVMAVMGVLLAVIPFAQGGVGGEGILVVVPAALIALGGAGIAVRYNPFSKLPTVKARELSQLLRQYLV